ncbi:NUDIX domain-containing protein [Streptomyces sp. SID8379]|uniref:NUDIX hydrolase n=1 Tax=unclassified Streptomyces TaxID=2593676 RepID=UPI000374B270|nr:MULTISPECIES: NUDIX domain-containing protein [unclassified Streptomyces]MYW69308.1 NUDIX domain-containing protein [Streptomyces sp. SID8379]
MTAYARRSARVLLIDGDDRVLLFEEYDVPGRPEAGTSWWTPGGGVEEGETLAEAASRELREETGLSVSPAALGPVVALNSGYADLGWVEGMLLNAFFHHRVPTGCPVDVSGQNADELRHYRSHRWWPVAELAASGAPVYPLGLPALMADLTAGRVPTSPVELPWQH